MSKVRQCDECKHRIVDPDVDLNAIKANRICAQGHKPRFYLPNSDNPYDTDWGWKRNCNDFEALTDGNRTRSND